MGLFGKRPDPGPTQQDMLVTSLQRHVDEAETRYLEVLRRELAKLLLESDPMLFDRTYRKARSMAEDLTRADAALFEAEEAALLQRFRSYPEFDLIGTWHVVSYLGGRRMISDDEIVDRYLEVTRMLLVLRRRHPYLRDKPLFEEREAKAFEDNMRGHLDRRLRARIEGAMQLYCVHRSGLEKGVSEAYPNERPVFRNVEVEVFDLPHMGDEGRYGVAFTETGECGAYGYFVFEDGRVHRSYYASEKGFVTFRPLLG